MPSKCVAPKFEMLPASLKLLAVTSIALHELFNDSVALEPFFGTTRYKNSLKNKFANSRM